MSRPSAPAPGLTGLPVEPVADAAPGDTMDRKAMLADLGGAIRKAYEMAERVRRRADDTKPKPKDRE